MCVVPAAGLNVGSVITEGERGLGQYPAITFNFSADFGQALMDQVLAPYVHPEHLIIGYRSLGAVIEVAAYIVVDLPAPACLPGYGVLIEAPSHTRGPWRHVIGTSADFAPEAVSAFERMRQAANGQYVFTLGRMTEAAVTRIEPMPWFLIPTTLYGDEVYERLAEAIGVPELAPRLASP